MTNRKCKDKNCNNEEHYGCRGFCEECYEYEKKFNQIKLNKYEKEEN